MIIGKGDKNGMEVVHNFKSTLYHMTGDPTGRFWAGVMGSGSSAKIVLGEVDNEVFKVLKEIESDRHPDSVKFSADGKKLISSNEDGTLTIYAIEEDQ